MAMKNGSWRANEQGTSSEVRRMTSSHDSFTRENCSLITDRFQNVRLLWTIEKVLYPPPDATHLKENDKEQNGPPVREQSMQPEKASAPLQTYLRRELATKWHRHARRVIE
jgi:hypothetical protein